MFCISEHKDIYMGKKRYIVEEVDDKKSELSCGGLIVVFVVLFVIAGISSCISGN